MWNDNKIETHCELCGGYSLRVNTCNCIECEYIGIVNRPICNWCDRRKEHKR